MRYQTQFADLQPRPAAVVAAHVRVEEIAGFLEGAFTEVVRVLGGHGLRPTGPPFARYGLTDHGFDIEAGFPCDGVVKPDGRVEPCELPGGRVARTLHIGAYGDVGAAYEAATTWLVEEGYVTTGAPWECYLDGPEVPEPRTEVFVPCAPARPRHPPEPAASATAGGHAHS